MNISELIDSFEAALNRTENAGSTTRVVRAIERKVTALRTEVDKLREDIRNGMKLTLPTDKQIEALKANVSPANDDLRDVAAKLKAALQLGPDIISASECQRAETLLERYKGTRASRGSGASRTGLRALPWTVGFTCVCGVERTSPSGDWGSIRHQAKMHADECEKVVSLTTDDFLGGRNAAKANTSYRAQSGFDFWTVTGPQSPTAA